MPEQDTGWPPTRATPSCTVHIHTRAQQWAPRRPGGGGDPLESSAGEISEVNVTVHSSQTLLKNSRYVYSAMRDMPMLQDVCTMHYFVQVGPARPHGTTTGGSPASLPLR